MATFQTKFRTTDPELEQYLAKGIGARHIGDGVFEFDSDAKPIEVQHVFRHLIYDMGTDNHYIWTSPDVKN